MYNITFTDNTQFKGGNIKNTRWNEIPDKQIKSIEYRFLGKKIYLEGFEEYNHIKLMAQMLQRTGHTTHTYGILLLGRVGKAIHCFAYDLQKKTFTKTVEIQGQELFNNPTTGWKLGYKNKLIIKIQ